VLSKKIEQSRSFVQEKKQKNKHIFLRTLKTVRGKARAQKQFIQKQHVLCTQAVMFDVRRCESNILSTKSNGRSYSLIISF
jgi:hypothetical protein